MEHIRIRVFPDANKARVEEIAEKDLIEVHVVSPASSGAANREAVQLLAEYLQTGKQIRIVSGHKRQQKIIAITN